MTSDDEREALAHELLRLSLPELVDVLRRVLPAHADQDDPTPTVLTLAEISWSPGEDQAATPPLVEAVAWPDRDHYQGGFGPEPALWEQGSCTECGLKVASTAKRAFCPLCGTTCSLT
ncbi:hypothetical protein [Actinomadura sp. 6N118]|uniref:hypothetical protein n=1 Tax=Actinomadura sp. 6N118 TaxID=3375151 RepID=UPI0037B37753